MIDKNKLKEKIQKTPSKDLLYLTVNPIDQNSLQKTLKFIEKTLIKGGEVILIVNKQNR